MTFLYRVISVLLVGVICGCANTTAPGQLGITRSQLLLVPTGRIEAMASESYAKTTTSARSAGKLNSDPKLTERVKRVADRLINEVGVYRQDAKGWDWQVNVIDSNDINAYCLPGGKIVILTGLVTRLELTDEELAGVVGHEIAHALREHSREKMSQAALSQAIVQGIANSSSKNAGAAGVVAGIGSQLFFQLPFSRDMEIEADSMGLELAARAGFDPRLAVNVWTKMQRSAGGGSKADFLSTHPSPERRITESEAALKKIEAVYRPLPVDAVPTVPSIAQTIQVTRPTAAANAPSAGSAPVAMSLVAAGGGQDAGNAEQLAKSQSCSAQPRAVLSEKGPGYESYSVACTSGGSMSIRCEFGNCRVLR